MTNNPEQMSALEALSIVKSYIESWEHYSNEAKILGLSGGTTPHLDKALKALPIIEAGLGGWRSMDTAPDNTPILLWVEDSLGGEYKIGQSNTAPNRRVGFHSFSRAWQPLPNPPQQPPESEGV